MRQQSIAHQRFWRCAIVICQSRPVVKYVQPIDSSMPHFSIHPEGACIISRIVSGQ